MITFCSDGSCWDSKILYMEGSRSGIVPKTNIFKIGFLWFDKYSASNFMIIHIYCVIIVSMTIMRLMSMMIVEHLYQYTHGPPSTPIIIAAILQNNTVVSVPTAIDIPMTFFYRFLNQCVSNTHSTHIQIYDIPWVAPIRTRLISFHDISEQVFIQYSISIISLIIQPLPFFLKILNNNNNENASFFPLLFSQTWNRSLFLQDRLATSTYKFVFSRSQSRVLWRVQRVRYHHSQFARLIR